MSKEESTSTVKDWMPAIQLAIAIATILGSTIPLYLHTDNKMHAEVKAIREEVREMRSETNELLKDFHGRLCAIEERNKSK